MADQESGRYRLIEMKLPLPWLLGTALAIVMASAYMAFSVDRMREDMSELKGSLKAWNERVSSIAADMALLRFRVETLEADKRAWGGGNK